MSIVVFAESSESKFKKSGIEAVEYAKMTADLLGKKVIAVCVGNDLPDESSIKSLGQHGADKIYTSSTKADSENIANIITEISRKEAAIMVVFSNNYAGKASAPLVAVQLQASIVSGVISVSPTVQPLLLKKTVYSNKAFAEVELTASINVISITPNSFEVSGNYAGDAVVESYNASISEPKITSLGKDTVKGKIPLTEAELVVSAGRGLKGPENWHLVEELADTLGAATACSKPVSDMHWRPHEEHVGQTGITIKPNLYIAIGISGAIQHLAGVSSSKVIVAVNKDPEAPFFKVADYGIVGDAFDVLPKLIAAAKAFKAAQ